MSDTHTFTALLTGNKRKEWSYDRLLILGVQIDSTPFRDHIWIKDSSRLSPYVPKASSKKKSLIQFTGRITAYTCSLGETKYTIDHIRNVVCLDQLTTKDYYDRLGTTTAT